MKRIVLTAFAIMALCCLCTKKGTSLFEVYYPCSLNGTICSSTQTAGDGTATPVLAPFTVDPESGQMNILTRDKSSGDILLSMNAFPGDVTTADSKTLTISQFSESLGVSITGGTIN